MLPESLNRFFQFVGEASLFALNWDRISRAQRVWESKELCGPVNKDRDWWDWPLFCLYCTWKWITDCSSYLF